MLFKMISISLLNYEGQQCPTLIGGVSQKCDTISTQCFSTMILHPSKKCNNDSAPIQVNDVLILNIVSQTLVIYYIREKLLRCHKKWDYPS